MIRSNHAGFSFVSWSAAWTGLVVLLLSPFLNLPVSAGGLSVSPVDPEKPAAEKRAFAGHESVPEVSVPVSDRYSDVLTPGDLRAAAFLAGQVRISADSRGRETGAGDVVLAVVSGILVVAAIVVLIGSADSLDTSF